VGKCARRTRIDPASNLQPLISQRDLILVAIQLFAINFLWRTWRTWRAAVFAFEEDTSTKIACAVPRSSKPREVIGCKFHSDRRTPNEFRFGALAVTPFANRTALSSHLLPAPPVNMVGLRHFRAMEHQAEKWLLQARDHLAHLDDRLSSLFDQGHSQIDRMFKEGDAVLRELTAWEAEYGKHRRMEFMGEAFSWGHKLGMGSPGLGSLVGQIENHYYGAEIHGPWGGLFGYRTAERFSTHLEIGSNYWDMLAHVGVYGVADQFGVTSFAEAWGDIDSVTLRRLSPGERTIKWIEGGAAMGGYALMPVGGGLVKLAPKFQFRAPHSTLRSGTGHGEASSITPGGTGRAFAGHGHYRELSGQTTVPKGTAITIWEYTGQSAGKLPDKHGRAIETGRYDLLNPADFQGSYTALPGSQVPNFRLQPPSGLDIMARSRTVPKTTPPSDLMNPNMGHVEWAACTIYKR
jgi:hypothetical protein